MWSNDGAHKPAPDRLLNVRTALILLLAFVVGGIAGALTFVGTAPFPAAVLAGGTVAGGAVALFDRMIGD